jgi:hypothetical protein
MLLHLRLSCRWSALLISAAVASVTGTRALLSSSNWSTRWLKVYVSTRTVSMLMASKPGTWAMATFYRHEAKKKRPLKASYFPDTARHTPRPCVVYAYA